MSDQKFTDKFIELTRNPPLLWQTRLYDKFKDGDFPQVIDLPTGLGKTMVMAVLLIARAMHPDLKLPTRLIYVVDRRTVVDQATDLAIKLRDNAKASFGIDLAISTLRGQLADTREWSRDPSKPAIIIGTVDLIGSALLFSGYRSGYKYRPHEAGLLGMDSLLVLDEAHLSKPFEKLLKSIEQFNLRGTGVPSVRPLKVIRMSATSSMSPDSGTGVSPVETSAPDDRCDICHSKEVFRLCTNQKCGDFDLKPDPDPNTGEESNQIITRFTANKTLSITTLGEKDKLNEKLADAATALATTADMKGKRIVVFVRSPDAARAIADRIRKNKDHADSVEILTGTMRGLERDELIDKPVMKRFLDGDEDPNADPQQPPVFLISTSAGEVGFDLNADHMVSDATTIDSLIQRLGRVNRRGKGDAVVQLFAEAPKMKDGKLVELKGLDKAIAGTLTLLKGVTDVSPQNIAALKKSAAWSTIVEGQQKPPYEFACSPEPATIELTDILLDAWSMTSIQGRMPGRPDVAPWLRGIADWEPPQTTLAWRAELDLDGFGDLDLDDIAEWFDTHRVLTHETLTVKTSDVASWFVDRWEKIGEYRQREIGDHPVLIDRGGIELLPLREVVRRLESKPADKDAFLRGAELVVPASFGGIERGKGLLDANTPEVPKDEEKKPLEEQQKARVQRSLAPDVADVRGRYREIITKTEEGEQDPRLLTGEAPPNKSWRDKFSRLTLSLASDDDKTVKLISYVPKFEKLDTGQKRQSLEGHVTDVRRHADTIIDALQLSESDPVRIAVELAADWHDHGKNREFFQRTVGGKVANGQRPWPDHVRGKSGGKDFGKAPRGYRHEFGSLREFIDAHKDRKWTDDNGTDLTQTVFDLALHLIVTHHGRGRPHFPKGGFDPDAEDRSEQIHTDAIRRFARLQRTYGWWTLAWLENLLRCADAMASADPKTGTYDAEGNTL